LILPPGIAAAAQGDIGVGKKPMYGSEGTARNQMAVELFEHTEHVRGLGQAAAIFAGQSRVCSRIGPASPHADRS
jgi:hypothetical protein